MRSQPGTESAVTIPQAAELLRVTEKTVRNYIDRGFLAAEKWNGAWRITIENIMEIYYKKYGKNLEESCLQNLQTEPVIQVHRTDYENLLQRSGRLDAAELLAGELRAELKVLGERLAQLEASAASGWTEARKFKEDVQELKKALDTAGKKEQEAQIEANWLRRELERTRRESDERRQECERLLAQAQKASDRLQARENALKACQEALRDLEARYRRNGFLD